MDLSSETQIGYDAQTLRDPFLEKSKVGISGSHSRSRVTCDVWHRSSMLNCGLYTDDVTALKRLMQVAGGGGGSSYASSDAYYNGQPVTMHAGLSTLQCGLTGTWRVETRPSFLPPRIWKDDIIIHVLIVLSIDTTSFLGHLLTIFVNRNTDAAVTLQKACIGVYWWCARRKERSRLPGRLRWPWRQRHAPQQR